MISVKHHRIAPFLLGMVSPFLLLVSSFKVSGKYRQWLFIAFITFHGATTLFPEGADATRHIQSVIDNYLNLGFNDFLDVSVQVLSLNPPDGYQDDIFIHILSFIAGLLGWPRFLYISVSFIYGFLFVKSVSLVLSKLKRKSLSFELIYFIILFFFWKNIEGINSIRNHTGAWYLFYMTLKYLEKRDRRYLYATLGAPLIHFQYLLVLPVIVLSLFTKPSKILLLTLFISSFYISVPQKAILNRIQTTELGESKTKAYVKDQEYFEKRLILKSGKQHIYTRIAQDGTMFRVMGLLVLVLLSYKEMKFSWQIQKILTIGVLLSVLANLFEFIPSVYNRVYQNAGLYILSSLILIQEIAATDSVIFFWARRILILILVPSTAFFIFFKLSQLASYISFFLLGSPLILFVAMGANISMKEFLINLLQ